MIGLRNKILVHFAMFFIICMTSPCIAASPSLPPNWPWRGIVIQSDKVPNAEDIKYLAGINVNAIELALTTRLVAKVNKLSGEEALKKDIVWADAMLDECKKFGITGIISIAQIPVDPSAGLTQESAGFWENPERLKEALVVAGRLALHFKDRGDELGAFEVLSEPLLREKGRLEVPTAWPQLMKDIVKEIRKHDPKRHIIVTPGPGGMASGYNGFKPLDDHYIIYGAHIYAPLNYTHQGIYGNTLGVEYPGRMPIKHWDRLSLEASFGPLIDFQKKNTALVFIGEFSVVRWAPGADIYLKDLISIFDSHGWGWAYFSFKSWHGWDPDYDTGYATNVPDDWKKHYVGRDTPRWKLLRDAFAKNKIQKAVSK